MLAQAKRFAGARSASLGPAAEHGFHHVRDGPILLGRHDGWVVVWNLRDKDRIDIERLSNHVFWTVRQPTGQTHLLKPIRLEDLRVNKNLVPGILFST